MKGEGAGKTGDQKRPEFRLFALGYSSIWTTTFKCVDVVCVVCERERLMQTEGGLGGP